MRSRRTSFVHTTDLDLLLIMSCDNIVFVSLSFIIFLKGEVCDPKLRSTYKLENSEKLSGFTNEDLFEVTICREQEIDQEELISK